MTKLELPTKEEATLSIEYDGKTIELDPVNILDLMRDAGAQAEKNGEPSKWKNLFTSLLEYNYGLVLNNTQAVLILNTANEMCDDLAKKSCPSQKSLGSTVEE